MKEKAERYLSETGKGENLSTVELLADFGESVLSDQQRVTVPTDRELWLEFGYFHPDDNNYHDMLWYNEGNADEFAFWIRKLMEKARTNNPSGRMYFLLRLGTAKFEIICDDSRQGGK